MNEPGSDAPKSPVLWLVGFRLARTAIQHIDRLAVQDGFVHPDGRPNRSDMIRNLVTYAVRHRPKGWKP